MMINGFRNFALVLALFVLTECCEAQELMPLDEYVKLNPEQIPSVQLYTYDRCSAMILGLIYAQKLYRYKASNFEHLMNEGYVAFTVLTIESIKNNSSDPESASKQEIAHMENVTRRYDEHLAKIVASGKEIEKDKLLIADNRVCMKLLKAYEDQEQKRNNR